MRYTAGLATKITGQTLDVSIPMPPGAKYQVYTRKEPIGVVAGIVPRNFPLMIGMWKVMPALAAGCSIVIKPSETTPLTLLRMAELASEAGVPPGVFNVVTGRGTLCGKALTEHPLIAKVSFTGSTPVGKHRARGGGSPDPRDAGAGAKPGHRAERRRSTAGDRRPDARQLPQPGQVCAASSRIYIEAPIYDQLVAGFEQAVKSLSVGPGMDTGAQINPLVSLAHRNKVAAYLDDARAKTPSLSAAQPGRMPTASTSRQRW